MPQPLKHESVRARRNKSSTASVLATTHDVQAPTLPADIAWHPLTTVWWEDLWASPMAPEYDYSDVHGLFMLAALMNQFWESPNAALAAEIRLQRQAYGLSPLDRRRLQWSIEQGEEAAEKTAKRKTRVIDVEPTDVQGDPRDVLGE